MSQYPAAVVGASIKGRVAMKQRKKAAAINIDTFNS
jgi:hypothetical protein